MSLITIPLEVRAVFSELQKTTYRELGEARIRLRRAWDSIRLGDPNVPVPEELKEEAEDAAVAAAAAGGEGGGQEEKKANRMTAAQLDERLNRPAAAQPPPPLEVNNNNNNDNNNANNNNNPPNAAGNVEPRIARQEAETAQAEIVRVKVKRRLLEQLRDLSVDPVLIGNIIFTLLFNIKTKIRTFANYLFDGELKHPGLNPFVVMLFNSQVAEVEEFRARYDGPNDPRVALNSLLNVILYGNQTLGRKSNRTWKDVYTEVLRQSPGPELAWLIRLPEPSETLSEEYLFSVVGNEAYQARNPFPSNRFDEASVKYNQSAYASIKSRLWNERIWHREAALCIVVVESLMQKVKQSLAAYKINYKIFDFVYSELNNDFALRIDPDLVVRKRALFRFWHLAVVCKYVVCCNGLVPLHLLNRVQSDADALPVLRIAAALFSLR